MYLFGGDRPWDASQFTASDDRVRGGKSQSYLTVLKEPESSAASQAEFSGHLDITALGGAGFASQRTADDVPGWDVSGYDVLVLDVARADSRRYTLTLKDEILPRRPDGRDQSTVSWEYDFVVGAAGEEATTAGSTRLVIPFGDFQPTYRGKAKPDADPLDLKGVKRISFMMRSFFGTQEGDFSIVFNSVAVEKKDKIARVASIDSVAAAKLVRDEQQHGDGGASKGGSSTTLSSWFWRLCGWGS
ncbi:complex I intermediate-associated protein 30 [Diaporthe helianthi]|uniref:Complex I intermediate-associated protein 30 n=1 Tax=Diaporthe helianthi TaxID=158607 RepID=A0A2P5I9M1_DIAHE|nr:complex I intermediate-associated protein 30 [Diaporthe helianthi]